MTAAGVQRQKTAGGARARRAGLPFLYFAAARLLGAGQDAIRRGLAGAVVRGRVEPVPVDAPFTVLIDYAHNEAAAESLLRTLRAYRPARLVVVFGCGGERSRLQFGKSTKGR